MKKGNKLTWAILTEDEKTALTLSINYGKSSWEAGEIMNKAHYKYLEIQARANKFFKMFNEYFEANSNNKIPEDCLINPTFRDFIIHTVFERVPMKKAVQLMGNSAFIVPAAKERILKENLDVLCNSEITTHNMFYDLIMEFDRWNTERILPISLQEPSAFKRRNKTRLIKHLNNLAKLDPFHIMRFKEKFKTKKHTPNCVYVALISNEFEGGYEVIRIPNREDINTYVSKHLRLYLFSEEVDADQFGYIVNKYLQDKEKNCKTGQNFWPLYRANIELASNYLAVNNIIPRRKNLEKAFRDMDHIEMVKASKKVKKIGDPAKRLDFESLVTPADAKNFWNI